MDRPRSTETRVINGIRYLVLDTASHDCRTTGCPRDAEMDSPYCYACIARRRRPRRSLEDRIRDALEEHSP